MNFTSLKYIKNTYFKVILSMDRPTHHAEVLLLLLLLVAAGLALLVEAVLGLDVAQVFVFLSPLLPSSALSLSSAAVIFGLRAAGG